MVNWHQYLESLCKEYAQWWQVYTITDVVGRRRVEVEPLPLLFDFGLMVQKVQDREEKGKEEKVERLGVLEGLRKYASDHVLLVGRPGSGKSTALARLLLEEAEKANLTPQPPSLRGKGEQISPLLVAGAKVRKGLGERSTKIPVLVELRYYRTSIIDLIQGFLQRHDPDLTVDAETLKTWLRQGELLLLVDGLNELPSEEARRDLQKFRQNFQKTTPMIFTTRDLGVGGDLDITKKLEMQPLSEPQMQQFVRAYLPQQGEEMLRQLGSRLREFGQTPLLLMMLCSVFADNRNRIPSNLGSVFRRFTEIYESRLKQDVPVSDQFRDWCPQLLEHLAWVMTCGEAATQLKVAIPKRQAQEVLREFLQDKVPYPEQCTFSWLKDLLKHHLIQVGAGDQIEFRHQLIQEYYTAESLLKLLPSLGDDELKREYLNYLKWTEPLVLILELVEDEAQAVRVVKLALEVDLRLGARLAGAVKPEWQEQTVGLVAGLDVPQLVKINLLCVTRSDIGSPFLFSALNNEDFEVRYSASDALGNIGSESVVSGLLPLLEDKNSSVRIAATNALKEISTERIFEALLLALKHEYSDVRQGAASALGKMGREIALVSLIEALNDQDSSVRREVASALGKIGSEMAVPALLQALNDQGHWVSESSAYALGEIGSEKAAFALLEALRSDKITLAKAATTALGQIYSQATIPALLEALKDENVLVRANAAYALGELRDKATIPALLEALKDENVLVRANAASALGELRDKATIAALLKALKDKDAWVRGNAASALGKIGSEEAVPMLLEAMQDKNEDSLVRANSAYALGQISTEAAVAGLLLSVKSQNYRVRESSVLALGIIGTETVVAALLSALTDEDSWIRVYVAEALGKIGTKEAFVGLKLALKDTIPSVRREAIKGLEKIGTEKAVTELLPVLKDAEFDVRHDAGYALRRIASYEILPDLTKLLQTTGERHLLDVITAIQNRCKFYNYTLTQTTLTTNTRIMHILHLSDLHFGSLDQANLWSNQLAEDLRNDINIPHLDALILSGDIANYSTAEEYLAAAQFLHNLRQDFPLKPEQIILVPGNHDISWNLAKQAYKLIDRNDYDGKLTDDNHIKVDESVIRVRDEAEYKNRFANFSQFYETIKGEPYPLDYDQQATLDHLPEQNLLILGLNSAWQLDHHYTTRASINTNALSNALAQIRRNPDYKNCLKIAVWHHPLDSAYSDRITDQGFLEQVAVNGFRFFLHGHIHKAETSLFRYDMSSNGRKIDRICAGTFGAPVREWVPGYPLQYNLLKIADNSLTVYTRRREELNGAWKPDARWLQGAGQPSLDYYAIAL